MSNEGNCILQWNMQGYATHIDELRFLIGKYKPKIIALQETKFKKDRARSLPNYDLVHSEPSLNPGGHSCGGVALYTQQSIAAKEIVLRTELQAVAVEIEYPFRASICSFYLPNSNWNIGQLRNIFSQLPAPVLILGDFNVHHVSWGSRRSTPQGQALSDLISELGLIYLNNGSPTHITLSSGTLDAIDLSLASPSIAVSLNWRVLTEPHHSDHFPIILTHESIQHSFKTSPKWNYNRADWNTFKQNFKPPHLSSNIEEDAYSFGKAILHAAENSIPQTNPPKHRNPVPWWTSECRNANKLKKKALNKFRRHFTTTNLIEFKKARAYERRTKQAAKKESWSTYVSTMTKDSTASEVWRKIKAISGRCNPPQIPILKSGNTYIEEPRDVAEQFASYYKNVFSNSSYSSEFLEIKMTEEANKLNFEQTNSHLLPYNHDLTIEELERALQTIKHNSAPGEDRISYRMISNLPDDGKRRLLDLYNIIWDTSCYPQCWKTTTIIPIYKKNKDNMDPGSYRPISLSCCLGKLLEAMVNYRLTKVIETERLISPQQAGFREGFSALDQLVAIENYIQNAFLERKHVTAVFFDLNQAYDRTWRYSILRQLYQWNFKGRLPQFIENLLRDRYFKVKIGNTLSSPQFQENGILQGSNLSCSLFLVADNDMVENIPAIVQRSIFADDFALYIAHSNDDEISSLQSAIDELCRAASNKGFNFSDHKTVAVHFCRLRHPHDLPQLYLNGTPITFKPQHKFLGLVLDSSLRWKEHINHLVQGCEGGLNLLRTVSSFRWGADRSVMLRIFDSLIRSKLDYGSAVYGSARKTCLKKVDRVYNAGLRIAIGAFRTSNIDSIYVESGHLPPQKRRDQLMLSKELGVSKWKLAQLLESKNRSINYDPEDSLTLGGRPKSTPPRMTLYRIFIISIYLQLYLCDVVRGRAFPLLYNRLRFRRPEVLKQRI